MPLENEARRLIAQLFWGAEYGRWRGTALVPSRYRRWGLREFGEFDSFPP
jgi:hypothetical protein